MNFEQLIASIDPDIHRNLKRAIEIGKWPDGRALSAEQRALCMQAVIAYERALPETERVGYIDRGSKAPGAMCDDDHHDQDPDTPQPLQFRDQTGAAGQ
ncbi:MAG TPA: DUF1315 family protein [Spongiibacteraceae bacterium]|jgi:uncharacterized protein YeaC (DUF1315 family)|nr:DUF1315 family protein [Spongiibacteraceae bacterium]HUH37886.1 DUF1315 family protein [Spongiibacteraceae bacterium]